MINIFTTYVPFAKATYKSDYFAYKSRFLLWSIANAVSFLAQLLLWKAIYINSNLDVLNGYSFQEMTMYLGISKVVECISFASVEGNVAKGIWDGRIAMSLIKPINYRLELLFRSFGQVIGSIFLFLPIYVSILIIFAYINGIEVMFNRSNYFLGVAYLILAFMINYHISLIFSCVIFKTIKSSGIYQLKKTVVNFFAGALFPVAFYPFFLRKAVVYLPFVYLRYYPSIVLQGKLSLEEAITKLCLGLAWLIVLAIVSSKLWNQMIKKLIVFGG